MAIQLEKVLNPEQAQAAGTLSGPVLIIAGAGSGKTRMITYRIAYMLEQGIPQSGILALTFTNKAAAEMSERITAITGRSLKRLTASTFHAFGLAVLRKFGSKLGYQKNFTVYDQGDIHSMIKTVLAELGIDYRDMDLYGLQQLISGIKTGRERYSSETAAHKKIVDEYNEHLLLYNAVDFDDLIMLPLKLFKEYPEVLDHYRNRYSHILVDEFQDTSMQQYSIIKILAEEHRNLCVVGDDDQSIYSWRGADYRNITSFERDFPECREIKLEQNYRSTGNILSAANSLIKNNVNRKDKRLWTGNSNAKGIISLTHPEDETEEADFITGKLREIHLRERLNYNDFGILVRTNSLLSQLEHACLASNIPYKVSGGQSFFQRKEIKDIISYLRVLANPDDDMALLRIINTPRRGIGKSTLQYFKDLAEEKKCSLYSAVNALVHAEDLSIRESIRIKAGSLVEVLEKYREVIFKSKDKAAVLRELVLDTGYRNHIIAEHQDNERAAKWKMDNIDLFINILRRWEKNPDNFSSSLFDFLGTVSLKGKNEPDQEEGKINLMTIHASKGLEFHTVFLAGVEDHIIPHKRSMEEDENNLEEERRLFYVAITRARVNLFMTSCSTRSYMREIIETVPSRFLSELPSDIIEQAEEDTVVDTEAAMDYFAMMREKMKSGSRR